jgi:threonine/homoserine/homoserine lactone efflux protein
MTWQVWLLFAVTEGCLCLSPGPAVLFVISHGLSRVMLIVAAAGIAISDVSLSR